MKLTMEKKLRSRLMIALACFGVLSLILLIFAWTSPGTIEENVPLYSYNHKAEVDYNVILRKNPITTEKSLGKGQFYLAPFIRHINTSFTYEFSGDKVADIKGEYDVIAYVQGIVKELDKIKIIWSKPYRLLSKQTFQSNDKQVSLTKEIPIDIKYYNDFVNKFFEDYKIPTQAILAVYWNVKVDAQTEQGPVQEELSPSITIPLNCSYFEISDDASKTNEGAIETTVTTKAPVNKTKLIIYSVLAIIFLTGFSVLYFRTGDSTINPIQKQLKKIMKEHGERIVSLDQELIITSESIVLVKAFDDLVRIADELGKPILLKYNQKEDEIPVFYVLNEPRIFTYYLFADQGSATDINNLANTMIEG